mmetsp:Transcript_39158/g.94060  ORF Transcript_39158/g.94060 Transcript_39158/m.94060 type:complete len:661 (-) Transcript_39158:22-2004(-)
MRAFAWLACVVTADLPIHCLRDEFVGHWELHISEVTPLGKSSRLVPKLPQQAGRPFCFHSAPNTNSENMEMIQTKTHEEWKAELGRTTTLTAQLTMRSEQEMVDEVSGHSLVAETPHGKGSWTTVYDEGFEARVPLPSGDTALLLATSRYECSDPSSETCGRNGDSIRPDGSVSGYESYCGRTMVGWYSVKSAAGELLGFGCWIGEKKDRSAATKVAVAVGATADVALAGPPEILGSLMSKVKKEAKPRHRVTDKTLHVNVDGSFSMDSGEEECNIDSIPGVESSSALPETWDWRKQFDGKWDQPVINQGQCGSCYVVSEVYSFQSRINIAMCKRGHCEDRIRLSPESALQCSYYGQGCDGGFPFLVGRHAHDIGVPTEDCAPYQAGRSPMCNSTCHRDPSKLWYAKDYGYVGGFYGTCSALRLMHTVREHGPTAVALEMPGPTDFDSSGFVTRPKVHHKLARDDDSTLEVHIVGQSYVLKSFTHALQSPETELDHEHKQIRECLVQKVSALPERNGIVDGVVLIDGAQPTLADLASRLQSCAPTPKAEPSKLTKVIQTVESFIGLGEPQRIEVVALNEEGINGWEYTTHAVVVVGWGQRDEEKYWIVRNSWGENFGDKGYFYLRRGEDALGIESQGVFAAADFTRGAGKAFLERHGMHL